MGSWALPGGIQDVSETLEEAACRVVQNKLGLKSKLIMEEEGFRISFPDLRKEARLDQLRTYSSGSDPRGGNTTVFSVQISIDKELLLSKVSTSNSFSDIKLFEKNQIPKLAFDHSNFVNDYFKFLRPVPKSEKDYQIRDYEKPSVTTDIIVYTVKDKAMKVLLIKRKSWPFEGEWALPGGFVEIDESLNDAAVRKLADETGVNGAYLEQLFTFGDVKRDPRSRVISVAYFALLPSEKLNFEPTSSASDAKWFDVDRLPKLAFDHTEILKYSLDRVKAKIQYAPIAFQLLPTKFTMTELQDVYETILGKNLDKRNFRKKIKEIKLVKELKETRLDGAHRPAMLYSFNRKKQ